MDLKVIYIAGMGRSGSTLLASLLGVIPGVLNTGESMRFLFNPRMRKRTPLCGCGEHFEACPFWGDIASQMDRHAIKLADRMIRMRNWRRIWREGSTHLDSVWRAQANVLLKAAAKSSADVVVDASKHPATGAALVRNPRLDVRVIHLLRDPRDVVRSYSTDKMHLQRMGSLRTVGGWVGQNWLSTKLSGGGRYLRVDYARLCRDAVDEFRRISDFVEVGAAETALSEILRTPRVIEQHALAGNPDKFDRRPLRITAPPDHRPVNTGLLALPLYRAWSKKR